LKSPRFFYLQEQDESGVSEKRVLAGEGFDGDDFDLSGWTLARGGLLKHRGHEPRHVLYGAAFGRQAQSQRHFARLKKRAERQKVIIIIAKMRVNV
jgi:hypothetical protein